MTDRSASWTSYLLCALLAAAVYLVAASCASDDPAGSTGGATTTPAAEPHTDLLPGGNPEVLSDWGQLAIRDGRLTFTDGVVPYGLNSTLFTDYAHKLRTVRLPDGTAAEYDPEEAFDFPVGTVMTKTFYYPVSADGTEGSVLQSDQGVDGVVEPLDLANVRLVETRVLARRADGWQALPYVWNADETEAMLARTGDLIRLLLVDDDAEVPLNYVVPNVNECASCHAVNHSTGAIQPIGLKARHLNAELDFGDGVEAQLGRWLASEMVVDTPALAEMPEAAIWSDDAAPLDDRARAYLDINCAHCHNPVGAADTSGLFLDAQAELGFATGVCKSPVAAGTGTGGLQVDIDPGSPDQSILVYRMESTDPAAMMPELGRSLEHVEGVELIRSWIESLPGEC